MYSISSCVTYFCWYTNDWGSTNYQNIPLGGGGEKITSIVIPVCLKRRLKEISATELYAGLNSESLKINFTELWLPRITISPNRDFPNFDFPEWWLSPIYEILRLWLSQNMNSPNYEFPKLWHPRFITTLNYDFTKLWLLRIVDITIMCPYILYTIIIVNTELGHHQIIINVYFLSLLYNIWKKCCKIEMYRLDRIQVLWLDGLKGKIIIYVIYNTTDNYCSLNFDGLLLLFLIDLNAVIEQISQV